MTAGDGTQLEAAVNAGRDPLLLYPNNLPAPLTSFVGRSAELEDLVGLLAGGRLVTVTGAAGCGKTRLALQAAVRLLSQFTDGVWLVELSPVTDAEFIGEAVATALGVREEAGLAIAGTLATYLKERRALLVLDGCEHLVEATAALAEELLRRCPELRMLVTSRESLRVAGEMTWRIPSLRLPEEALALFIDRARLADSSFRLRPDQEPAAELLCRRLDGIPLAIELAAAHVRVMSVSQILERIEDRFRLLTGGSRTALPRQQTLRAAIDWSYHRLDDLDALLFRRLSVFAGDCALDSVEAVCCDERIPAAEVVDRLARLADKSLLVPEAGSTGYRYRLLETLGDYGRERLVESGEGEILRRRHSDHFLRIAETATQARLAEDRPNLARALEFLRAAKEEGALRLAVALIEFWDSAGYVNEARERLELLLAEVPALPDLRARALDGAGWMALRQGDMSRARELFDQSRELLAEAGDSAELTRALSNLGLASVFAGEFELARDHLEESLRVGTRAGATKAMAGSLMVLGVLAYFSGDLDECEARAKQSQKLAVESADAKLAGFLEAGLGVIALERGHHQQARERFRTSLRMSVEIGDRLNVALLLEAFCRLAAAESAWSAALQFGAAAEALRDATGARSIPLWQARVDAACEAARGRLGADAATAASASGRSMDYDRAVELARDLSAATASPPRPPETRGPLPSGLTRRELEIAVMVAQGASNRDVAERLFLSQRTVEGHVENIRGKLGFHSRTQIAAWVVENGFSSRGPT
jgi:predicted ATPase/DNA-binding NarL/FixJ family response regulator